MRLQIKSNNFAIVDKYIKKPRVQEQIAQSSFVKFNYDSTHVHIEKSYACHKHMEKQEWNNKGTVGLCDKQRKAAWKELSVIQNEQQR